MKNRPWSKHVAKGTPVEVEIPDNITPQELLRNTVKKFPNHTALSFFDKTWTYQEFYGAIQKLASALAKKGVVKGTKVAIMLPNCPQFPISFYGILMCGGTVVQVNPMYRSSELTHILNDSGVETIIIYDQLVPVLESVKNDVKIKEVITVSFDGTCTFTQLMKEPLGEVPNPEIDSKEDIAVIQYTGGTTGRAKGAMLSYYSVAANTIQSAATSMGIVIPGDDKVLAVAPLFHSYGMTTIMGVTFYNGNNLILLPRFEIEQVAATINKFKPTIFPGVPTMYIALLDYAKENEIALENFKICISGSAPLPSEILNQIHRLTGTNLTEGYGLSEASPVTHRNPVIGLQKVGSIGIPVPNTDAKIVDVATGENEVPVGEVGELIVKGPQIMKGYLNMPEETSIVLRDGWLYTGDLAKMDEDGFFYIVGRKKEMILASGFNVYPIEVEDVIYEHPKVSEAAVIGVPDAYRGETIKAVIVLKKGEEMTEEELIQFCREKLAAYKVPQTVEFIDEMPKTAVGKILKWKLQELFS